MYALNLNISERNQLSDSFPVLTLSTSTAPLPPSKIFLRLFRKFCCFSMILHQFLLTFLIDLAEEQIRSTKCFFLFKKFPKMFCDPHLWRIKKKKKKRLSWGKLHKGINFHRKWFAISLRRTQIFLFFFSFFIIIISKSKETDFKIGLNLLA